MYVSDLIKELEAMPREAWVDIMFKDGQEVYTIQEVSVFKLSQGQERVIIDIADDMPLRAV